MWDDRISVLRDAHWLTPERIRRIAIVFAVVELVALVIEWRLQSLPGFADRAGAPLGEDFINYWSGARLAMQGHASTVYNLVAFWSYEQYQVPPFPLFRWYAYPPVTLLLTAPLASLPYVPAYFLWLGAGTGLCGLLFSRFMSWPMAFLAAWATPAVFFSAVSGQNGQFSAVLLAGGLMLMDRRPTLSGILFGLLCYKPHLGILIPFALAADRRWKTFFSAFATIAALIGASVVLFGWEVWAQYLHSAPLKMNQLIVNQGQSPDPSLVGKGTQFVWYGMPTVYAALRLMDVGTAIAYGGQALSAAAALAIAIAIWRGSAPAPVKGAVLVIATLLITPYAWSYDLVVLTFAIVWLWQAAAGGGGGFYPFEKSLLAGTLAMTLLYGVLGKVTHLAVIPILLWTVLLFVQKRVLASATGTLGLDALVARSTTTLSRPNASRRSDQSAAIVNGGRDRRTQSQCCNGDARS